MSPALSVNGEWPEPVDLRRGWALAKARPWNDDSHRFASIRLQRGGARFLARCVEWLEGRAVHRVLSPAMMPEQTGIWMQCGFRAHLELIVYERSVPSTPLRPAVPAVEGSWASLATLAELDNRAFPPIWRVGRGGLTDAMAATANSVVITVEEHARVLGFSIVGETGGISYLQRLAVEPSRGRGGIGRSLVRHSLNWAAKQGARTMLLNTQPDNKPAAELYLSEGCRRSWPTCGSGRVWQYGRSSSPF